MTQINLDAMEANDRDWVEMHRTNQPPRPRPDLAARIILENARKDDIEIHPEDMIRELSIPGVTTDCIVRDWSNEQRRADHILTLAIERKDRRDNRGNTGRGDGHRRIICSKVKDGRERQLHSTKGWRNYRELK
jgi:hypothetical protein